MARLKQRRRGTRGAAALEFTLVVPWMFVIFGGLISFGLVVWAQYQLGMLTMETVRNCVASQQSLAGNAQSSLQACATSQFQTLYRNYGGQMCNQTPTVQATTTPVGTMLPSGKQTYLLQVTASCQKNYIFLLNQYTQSSLTSQNIRAQSAMPFTP